MICVSENHFDVGVCLTVRRKTRQKQGKQDNPGLAEAGKAGKKAQPYMEERQPIIWLEWAEINLYQLYQESEGLFHLRGLDVNTERSGGRLENVSV